jgi:hypothetical protein
MNIGSVGVSITCGPIAATSQPIHPRIGQQVTMGDDAAFILHITPEMARQWIQTLTPIAEEESK